jgi:hypothetical protein
MQAGLFARRCVRKPRCALPGFRLIAAVVGLLLLESVASAQAPRLLPSFEPLPPITLSDTHWDSQVQPVLGVEPVVTPDPSPLLRDPLLEQPPWSPEQDYPQPKTGVIFHERFAPSGFTGPSGIAPREGQSTPDFEPIEDRWRIGMQPWDRYDQQHGEIEAEYPFVEGSIRDPYHQNVLKGDYPILGQHLFLNITAVEDFLVEARESPTPTSPFESTTNPDSSEFFGDNDQFFVNNNIVLSTDLTHGDSVFKPADWRIKLTHIFNVNHLVVDEFGVVGPNIGDGTARTRFDYALEEWFYETKLADLSADYDFMSVRAGSQFFSSDFKGFIFSDTNRGVRLFGTRHANRDQFNVVWFDQQEKDTNSLLNSFDDRHQNTVILNYYRQDFIWPGYTTSVSYHYNKDQASFKFDNNNFLVRPDPIGVATPHEVNSHYLGFAGEGHINRINITHAYYLVLGEDELNPIAGAPQDIEAHMAALELSIDRDWARFRASYFWASGDTDPFDSEATGFDSIFDAPNFAGGQFSFWNRQQIRLFGGALVNRLSLIPDLSNKFQGQPNHVNPGLHLFNLGVDMDLTPKFKSINNVNFLWFDQTEVLERFVFQNEVRSYIGADLSTGVEYRPLLNNNIIILGGISTLIGGEGFKDLYGPLAPDDNNNDVLVAGFANAIFQY